MRVFPDPVGPRNKKLPTGRPGEFKPAQKTWYRSTIACTASSCLTIFARSASPNSTASGLRRVESRINGCVHMSPSSRTLRLATVEVTEHDQLSLGHRGERACGEHAELLQRSRAVAIQGGPGVLAPRSLAGESCAVQTVATCF